MRKALLLCAAACCGPWAGAVPVERWVQTSQADFAKGHAERVSLLSLGQLALAPELKPLLAEPVPHVWALAVDAKGVVYAATGTEAKLLRIAGGKVETVFASPTKSDIELLAAAAAPDGAIYVSAAPSGTLYRIGPDGKAASFYKGDDPYIWALAVGPDGSVYAATGPKGKLLKISPKGKAATLLAAGSRHLLSVAVGPDGSVYAGSDKEGLLYHVSPKGEARVAYDTGESDIRALAFDAQGRLYFATAGTGRPAAAPSTPTLPSLPGGALRTLILRRSDASEQADNDREGDSESSPAPSPAPVAPSTKPGGANAIYRLNPGGDVTRVASLSGAAFYTLLWHNNQLYAGTGSNGKLLCIENGRAAQLADLDDSQVTAFAVAQGRLLLATANSGQVYQVAADHADSGTLVSDVHDSASMSRWGTIAWDARLPRGTAVTLATRSGNVSTPDETWSAWSAELSRAEGDHIPSPPARFIQFRATLKTSRPDSTPVLDEVVIAYAQTNARPVITQVQLAKPPKPRRPTPMPQPGQITTLPSAATLRSSMASSGGAPQAPASPRGPFADHVRITWQANDPNKDDLVYAVYFRGEDETTWKKLRDELNATFLDWDTHAVPDGPYRIRVVASDTPTNPPEQAQHSEKITEAFIVDNTPPAVSDLAVRIGRDRSLQVSGKCSDAGSGLADGEYSIDGGEWVSIVPVDRIFDSSAEALNFRVSALEKGEHTIVVRVRDQAENSGAAKSVFSIP